MYNHYLKNPKEYLSKSWHNHIVLRLCIALRKKKCVYEFADTIAFQNVGLHSKFIKFLQQIVDM